MSVSYSLHKVTRYHLSIFTAGEICVWCTHISCFRKTTGTGISLYHCHCYGKTQKQGGRIEQVATNSISPKGEQNVPPPYVIILIPMLQYGVIWRDRLATEGRTTNRLTPTVLLPCALCSPPDLLPRKLPLHSV